MNNGNLKRGNKATEFKSGHNAVENGRKGGIASGKAKREKANMRKAAQALLDAMYEDKNGNKKSGMDIVMNGLLKNAVDPSNKNWAKAMDLLVTLTGADKDTNSSIEEVPNDPLSESLIETAKELDAEAGVENGTV